MRLTACNARLDSVGRSSWLLEGEGSTEGVITEASCEFGTFHYGARSNLHPARIVSPVSRKARGNGEDRCASATCITATLLGRQRSRSGVVVNVEPVRATAELRTVACAQHATVRSGCRYTSIGDGGTAI